MGVLSGLSDLGLGRLEGAQLYEKEEKKKEAEVPKEKETPSIEEKDFLLEKSIECPVCHNKFKESKVKTGKARLIKQDKDLRPIYLGIDTGKYDVCSCPSCGYTALDKWFSGIAAPQAKLVKENISRGFKRFKRSRVVSYEEAMDRYKMALANSIVKKGKDSEKAYTCLKMAWIARGYRESYDVLEYDYEEKISELKEDENELLHNALEGFISARQTEVFPIAGMDTVQLDYLLSVLCLHENRLDEASRFIMSVLQSRTASSRIKNKSLDIKEEILEKRKIEKQS